NHPGVAVVASSGDDGYGVSYPASSSYVTAVGGTSLVPDSSSRGFTESVWNNTYGGPGSGCSVVEAKPAFQTDTGCAMRTVADVAAFAPGPHGDIAGTVTDASTGAALAGASVTASGAGSTITDAQGHYDLTVPPGSYDVTASAYGYRDAATPGVVLAENARVTVDL